MAGPKISTTVRLTERANQAIKLEAKRLQISEGDVIRRWIDPKVDEVLSRQPGLGPKLYADRP